MALPDRNPMIRGQSVKRINVILVAVQFRADISFMTLCNLTPHFILPI